MRADLNELVTRVGAILYDSEMKEAVRSFHLEEGEDYFGSEFLRVIFDMRDDVPVSDDRLDVFARTIEDALIPMDDRFPSVRFADAA